MLQHDDAMIESDIKNAKAKRKRSSQNEQWQESRPDNFYSNHTAKVHLRRRGSEKSVTQFGGALQETVWRGTGTLIPTCTVPPNYVFLDCGESTVDFHDIFL